MDTIPIELIDEIVQVEFEQPPTFEKRPTCPTAFIWQAERYVIVESLSEWEDFTRRNRMSRNTNPAHATRAAVSGSWGCGRSYFRVRVQGGRIFDLYFDRAPRDATDRKGHWYLVGERAENNRV